jgi:hypothetical protein
MQIVQKREPDFYAEDDEEQHYPIQVWSDTTWSSLEKARKYYTDCEYRLVKVLEV